MTERDRLLTTNDTAAGPIGRCAAAARSRQVRSRLCSRSTFGCPTSKRVKCSFQECWSSSPGSDRRSSSRFSVRPAETRQANPVLFRYYYTRCYKNTCTSACTHSQVILFRSASELIHVELYYFISDWASPGESPHIGTRHCINAMSVLGRERAREHHARGLGFLGECRRVHHAGHLAMDR